jgi:hypothetical protein
MISFGITNTFCGMKRQHLQEMKNKFDKGISNFKEVYEKRHSSAVQITFEADLKTLTPPETPVDMLQAALFEKLSVVGRPLNVICVLSQTIQALDSVIKHRNSMIAGFKAANLPDAVLAHLYFGIRNERGLNTDYPDALEGMFNLTDDCIFFSHLLCQDLSSYGRYLAKSFGRSAPKIHNVDFEKASKNGLLPDEAHYTDWLAMPVSWPTDDSRDS